jgi:hypothetical protein
VTQPRSEGRGYYAAGQTLATSSTLPSKAPPVPNVRADIVYLRQDFSVMHRVVQPASGPDVQRFDYLVRESDVPEVVAAILLGKAARKRSYPQREAVRYALSQLSNQGGGP